MTEATLGAVFSGYAAVLGVVIGSFLNVCIDRIPENRSVVRPRSACDACGVPIRARDNIPLLSYVLLRGRCRDCGATISPRVPLIELLGGLLGWLAFHRVMTDPADLDLAHGVQWVAVFGFLCSLVVAAYVDLKHHIIPDETSLYATPVWIGLAGLAEWLGYSGWLGVGFKASVLGAAACGVFFSALTVAWWFLFRREGLGWGDVKLFMAFGAVFGVIGILPALVLMSVFASIVGVAVLIATRKRAYLPAGPPLALAACLHVLYGDRFIQAMMPGLAELLHIR